MSLLRPDVIKQHKPKPNLKDSDFIGIFYCFSNFGTILIIIIKRFRFYRNLLLFFKFQYYPYYSFLPDGRDWNRKSPKPESHSTTKLHSYIDPHPTMCSARFGVDPDYRSGARAKSGFSDFPHYLRNLPSDLSNAIPLRRRSGQELPFIFFELRAATCL